MNALKVGLWSVCFSAVSFAQGLQVIPVPWTALDPTVPHAAYNSHATTFKAIARGGNGTYLVEWDFNGDGVFDYSVSTTNRYNLSTRFTYPNQAFDLDMVATVRVTSNGETVVGAYPVHIYADVPANPASATARQLQVMRNVALDDGLWFLHNQLTRTGDETNVLTGATITAVLPVMTTMTSGAFLEALGRNQHSPAFPPAYIGDQPNPMENAMRWATDPYAEDAARLVNGLLAAATVVGVAAADESNMVGFYPEVTATPIPGTDDGIGLYIGSTPGDQTTGWMANALRGLAVSHLTGYVAQVGDANRVLGRRLEFIIQQLVDGLVWAQNDGGSYPGSWYYTPNANADLMGEYTGGALEVSQALWLTEQAMKGSGVVVPNLAKARLVQYLSQVAIPCAQGGTGVAYFAGFTTCDISLSAVLPISLGWVGANGFSATDTRLAFPSYNGRTRGQLRSLYDASLVYVANAFGGSTSTTYGWDTGFVEAGDFSRVDGRGDHWSMLHWARAARAVEPELVTFGPNDYARLFTRYLVNNQATNGGWNWTYSSSLGSNNDNAVGTNGQVAWALLTLSPDEMAPVATAHASALTAPEGTALTFSGFSTAPGVFTWDFGNGEARTGASVDYAFPDNGTFNVTLTVTTPGGSVATDAVTVTISNVAPQPNAGPDLTVDEGDTVSFAGTWTDPGTADTHTVAWTFGDGTGASTAAATHTYADNGVFNAQFAVTDDDGDVGTDTAVITVRNVAPTITSMPGASADVSVAYNYALTFTDPGVNDTHTCSAEVAPAAATLTGCTLSWTPANASAAPVPFTLCVTDSDGAKTCQSFSVSVTVVDTDGDGLPDAWETANFGDLSQTAGGDPDQDGLTNLAEFLGGTDPQVYDGPSAPSAPLPACGGSVTDPRPTLTVSNATDPQLTPLLYDFEVYDDAALTSLVLVMADVPAGATTTSWRVPVQLQEDTRYWWRARARDQSVYGAWTQPACSFVVNAVNSLPGAPSLDSPSVGAQVATLQPTLSVGNAVDPEGDALTYEFQVFLGGTAGRLPAGRGGGQRHHRLAGAGAPHRRRRVHLAGAGGERRRRGPLERAGPLPRQHHQHRAARAGAGLSAERHHRGDVDAGVGLPALGGRRRRRAGVRLAARRRRDLRHAAGVGHWRHRHAPHPLRAPHRGREGVLAGAGR